MKLGGDDQGGPRTFWACFCNAAAFFDNFVTALSSSGVESNLEYYELGRESESGQTLPHWIPYHLMMFLCMQGSRTLPFLEHVRRVQLICQAIETNLEKKHFSMKAPFCLKEALMKIASSTNNRNFGCYNAEISS